jgi:hypothetical protein
MGRSNKLLGICLLIWTLCAWCLPVSCDETVDASQPSVKSSNEAVTPQFQLRKTYDGSKQEKDPASLFWFQREEAAVSEVLQVDFAAKISEWYPVENGRTTLSFYPVAEWHRSTDSISPKNNASVSARSELYTGRYAGVNLVASYKYTQDTIKDKTTHTTSLLLRPYNIAKDWYPGRTTRCASNPGVLFQYYPYVGYEAYDPVSGDVTGDAVFVLGRLHLESQFPGFSSSAHFQALATYAYRSKLSGSAPVTSHPQDLQFELNYYFNKDVSVGYTFSTGNDADDSFVHRSQQGIGLKVKIN